MSIVSKRVHSADAAFAAVRDFYMSSRYAERRTDADICDFTFGNPHEMPLDGLVSAIRERAVPHDKNWFAYKTSEEEPQAFLAERVGRELGLAFEPADIALTAGAFAAIMVAFRLVLDAGDEAMFSEPAWFCYEPMLLAADAVPRKVPLKAPTFDLDLAAIEAAIGPKTRLVIVNSPHNPTGRIYGRDMLTGAGRSARARLGAVRPAHLPAVRRALPPPALRRPRLRQPGRDLSMDVHLLQLRQGAARARPAARLSGDVAADAAERSAGAARRDVLRADGARLVLSERRHAIRGAGPRGTLDRSGRAGAPARSADGGVDAAPASRCCRRKARSISGAGGRPAIRSGIWNALADRDVFVLPGSIMNSPALFPHQPDGVRCHGGARAAGVRRNRGTLTAGYSRRRNCVTLASDGATSTQASRRSHG